VKLPSTYNTMNLHIKSNFQFDSVTQEEDKSTIGIPVESGRSTVLKPVKSLHIKRHLLEANKTQETFIGDQNSETNDRFGRVLRRLRVQQGVEAFVVASKACITVWQLYELETGKDTLFYTPGLRYRAAQRVAEFLGTTWSDILEGRVSSRAIPAPTAQLRLLKNARTDSRLNLAKTSPASAAEEDQIEQADVSRQPLSTASFLRVADVQR
jgi:transcriptional regulator with XRE-family HTH domain